MNQVNHAISSPVISNTTFNVALSDQSFLDDVLNGLCKAQKTIPCKWFYDDIGSALFEQITKTPEYYPTRVEASLLKNLVSELSQLIPDLTTIIEPGSGASVKTRILLDALSGLKTYIPMDISAQFLNEIAVQLAKDYLKLNIKPMIGDFTERFEATSAHENGAQMLFFPGSTIGNFSPDEAQQLLMRFHDLTANEAWLLIGVDNTQNAAQLKAAYNDKAGLTAAFNLNVLARANSALGADFNCDDFAHDAVFNPTAGRVEMHLKSLKAQSVLIQDSLFTFKKGETIFTESCYKYTHAQFLAMANAAQWQLVKHWQDDTISAFTIFLLKASK